MPRWEASSEGGAFRLGILERFEALQMRLRVVATEADRAGLIFEFAAFEICAFEAAELELLRRRNEVSDGRSIARTPSAGFHDQTANTDECDELVSMPYLVQANWDAEAEVWVAMSEVVPGLATEAKTVEALEVKLRKMVPELLEANDRMPVDGHVTVGLPIQRQIVVLPPR